MTRQEDYERVAQAKLKTLKANLAKLEAKAKEEQAEGRLHLNKKIDSAKAAIKEGEAQLAKLIDAGEDILEEVKEELEAVWKKAEGFIDDLFKSGPDKKSR